MDTISSFPDKQAKPRYSHSQRGRLTEESVAWQLMAHSAGRLTPFRPNVDDDGIDLVLFDKPTGVCLPIQIKGWHVPPSQVGTIQFDVRRSTFRPVPNGFLLTVWETKVGMTEMAWLVPLDRVHEVARSYPEKFSLSPSTKPESADRYTPWRCLGMDEVCRRLIDHICQAAQA